METARSHDLVADAGSAFAWAIALNGGFVVIEAGFGNQWLDYFNDTV